MRNTIQEGMISLPELGEADGVWEWLGGMEFEGPEAMAFAAGMSAVVFPSFFTENMGKKKTWNGVLVGAGFATIVGGVGYSERRSYFFGAGMIAGAVLLEGLYGKIGGEVVLVE